MSSTKSTYIFVPKSYFKPLQLKGLDRALVGQSLYILYNPAFNSLMSDKKEFKDSLQSTNIKCSFECLMFLTFIMRKIAQN